MLAAEVDSSASLAAMRAGIERQTGVLAEQQRLLILGAPSKASRPVSLNLEGAVLLTPSSLLLAGNPGFAWLDVRMCKWHTGHLPLRACRALPGANTTGEVLACMQGNALHCKAL